MIRMDVNSSALLEGKSGGRGVRISPQRGVVKPELEEGCRERRSAK